MGGFKMPTERKIARVTLVTLTQIIDVIRARTCNASQIRGSVTSVTPPNADDARRRAVRGKRDSTTNRGDLWAR